jgi:hypothetical protein
MAENEKTSTNLLPRVKVKRITTGELKKTLRDFRQKFENPKREVKISTPQADRGIGPVQYNLNLPVDIKPSLGKLRILNRLIDWEKVMGDKLIKLDATLLFVASGKEDPKGFLPAGCRAAIRTEMQE